MGDDFRSLRESIVKMILSSAVGEEEPDDERRRVASATADTLAGLRSVMQIALDKAGRGKDDVVQIVAKEIGLAVAAMLKEPLAEMAKHQRLQVTFEFSPKNQPADDKKTSNSKPRKRRSTKASGTKPSASS